MSANLFDRTPFPFDPVSDGRLLSALGYVSEEVEAHWEDVGGPESVPNLQGHPAYTAWTKEDQFIIVVDGEVVDWGTDPYFAYDPEGF